MGEGERFIREQDVKPTCLCESRTCGTHRCLPSRWAWGTVIVLLIYAICMHSFQFSERQGWQTKTQALWKDHGLQEIHAMLEDHNQAFVTLLLEHEGKLLNQREVFDRISAMVWTLQHPELERDVKLWERLERLDQHVKAHAHESASALP